MAPLRRAVEQDNQRHCRVRLPPELGRDALRQAPLHVESAEKLLCVHENRLDFGDEQQLSSLVEREQINPSAIAVVIEAHFRLAQPVIVLEPAHQTSRDSGVVGIKQTADFLLLPADIPGEINPYCRRHAPCGPHCQSADLPTLDQAALRRTNSGDCGQVDEAPTTLVAPRANRRPETAVVHTTHDRIGPGLSAA